MWSFLRKQLNYFIWGFAASLAIIVAYQVGLRDLVNYALISAAVGVVISVGIFFLERAYPDNPQNRID